MLKTISSLVAKCRTKHQFIFLSFLLLSNNIIAQVTVYTSITDVTCHAEANGSINITATGGSGNYNFAINSYPWQASPSFSALTAGEYSIHIKDLGSNEVYQNASLVFITEPTPLLVSTTSISHISCHGNNDGQIALDVSGGIPPYTYYWSGPSITQGQANKNNLIAGIYSVTVMDMNACTTSLNIALNQPHEIAFTMDQTHPYCDGGNGEIIITNIQGGLSPYLYSIDAGISWQTDPNFTALSAGNYSIMVRDANSCIAVQQATLLEPETASASGPSEVCAYEAQLTANNPRYGNGMWSVIEGSGAFDNVLDPNTIVKNIGEGQNIYRWSVIGNNCTKYADVTIFNNKLNVNAGIDQTLCSSSAHLNATPLPPGTTGIWILNAGNAQFDDASQANSFVSNLSKGLNRLSWQIHQNGCISTDEVLITNNQPSQAIAGSNQTICSSETQLNSTPAMFGVGQWSIISGSAAFNDLHDPHTSVSNLAKGVNVLRWTVSNASCTSSANLIIENNLLDVNAGADQGICSKTSVLQAVTPLTGSGEWSILPGVGGGILMDSYNPNTSVGGLSYGHNGFIWSVNNNGCISRDTVIISNNVPYPVNAGNDQIISGTISYLNASPLASGIGEWSIIKGSATFSDWQDPFALTTSLSNGENILRWTARNEGCTDYDDVTITNGTPTYISDKNKLQNALKVYPSPMDQQLNIELTQDEIIESISIHNISGMCLWTKQNINNSAHKLNVSHFKSGIYLINVIDTNQQVFQKKIIKK